jgi:hypothetical protein
MFSPGVLEKIGCYVYRLIDPQTGDTFYVGKGTGQRVFSHLDLRLDDANREGPEIDTKTGRVAEIKRLRDLGLKPSVCIHRHGMTDDIALQVEAALIDSYPGLSNLVSGQGAAYGPQTPEELEEKYALPLTPFERGHKYLLVFVNKKWVKGMKPIEVYAAAHYAWGVNRKNAQKSDYVLAISQGVVRGCFVAHEWLEATRQNFPEHDPDEGRSGFRGGPVSTEVWDKYVPTKVPNEAMPQGKGPTSFCYWPRSNSSD